MLTPPPPPLGLKLIHIIKRSPVWCNCTQFRKPINVAADFNISWWIQCWSHEKWVLRLPLKLSLFIFVYFGLSQPKINLYKLTPNAYICPQWCWSTYFKTEISSALKCSPMKSWKKPFQIDTTISDRFVSWLHSMIHNRRCTTPLVRHYWRNIFVCQ